MHRVATAFALLLVIGFSGCTKKDTSPAKYVSRAPANRARSAPEDGQAGGTGRPVPTPEPMRKQAAPSAQNENLVYQMYEKHMAIMEDEGTNGQPLSAADRKQIANWLSKQRFKGLELGQEKDMRAWRNALLQFLKEAPASGYSRGLQSWDPMKKAMAVLADFEANGKSATTSGYPLIAESINDLLGIAKGTVLAAAEQDPDSLERVREPVRYFTEYFYIFNFLAGAKARNPMAQAALLAVRPKDIEQGADRDVFLRLHERLARVCRTHPQSSNEDIDDTVIELVLVLRACKITDSEIQEAGGEKLLRMTTSLRNLRDVKGS